MHKNIIVKGEKDARKFIYVDLFFSFFPITVNILIRIITKSWENIFTKSDISFLALILFGQTISKLVNLLLNSKNKLNSSNMYLLFALLLLFGFFPPAVFLMLIELKQGNIAVYFLQNLWLLASVIFYYVIGTSSIIMKGKKITDKDFINEK